MTAPLWSYAMAAHARLARLPTSGKWPNHQPSPTDLHPPTKTE